MKTLLFLSGLAFNILICHMPCQEEDIKAATGASLKTEQQERATAGIPRDHNTPIVIKKD